MPKKRKCYCNWTECEEYRVIVLAKASTDHSWQSNMIRLHFDDIKNSNMTNKKLSWLVCVLKHLISKIYDYTTPKDIYLYPHHFPLSLLNWRKNHPKIQMSTLIDINQVKAISTNDLGNRQFMEYTNYMYYMLKKSGYDKHYIKKISSIDMMNRFHQSPMTTREILKYFIKELDRQSNVVSKLDTIKDTDLPSTKIEMIETVSKKSTITIQIRSKSPAIVPSVLNLHQRLIHKFKEDKGSRKQFYNRESVKEIAKLIHIFHRHKASFLLSKWQNIAYYTWCIPEHTIPSVACTYFTLSRRKYTVPVYCENCQDKISNDKRKRNRIINTSSRARPFETLTEDEKMVAYKNRY